MIRKSMLLLVLVLPLTLIAVNGTDERNTDGSITAEMLFRFEASVPKDPAFQSLSDALRNRRFSEVFANPEVLRNHNDHYTYEIKTGVVTNQKGTGRCWMYAALNTVRPYVVRRLNMDDFEFSTSFLFFWDKLEKANVFLERVLSRSDKDIRDPGFQKMLRSPVDDGGYWQNCVDLVEKYGVVPASAMPETASTHSSREMNQAITWLLRDYALRLREMKQGGADLSSLRRKKEKFLEGIYRILSMHLGAPVKSFPFRYYQKDKKGKKKLTEYATYSPRSFMKKFVSQDLGRFVMVANWPARQWYRYYQWEDSNNVLKGRRLDFINLPNHEIKAMMVASIQDRTPVNFSADVGKQLDRKHGIMHADFFPYSRVYGVEFLDKKGRNSLLRNINSTHAMVIMGVDLVNGKPLKWKVENSWGTKRGNKGYFAMYDNWFDRYVVRVVLDRKYVPEKILDLLKTKPSLIPYTEPEQ